jgi:putative MFS transporter
VGSIVLGGATDRFGRRPVFGGAMLWYAAATLVMGTRDSAGAICAWRFVAGLGMGVQMVTIDCYLTELAPRHLRGRAFSVAQFLQLLGVPAAHLLGHAVVERDPLGIAGWRWLAVVPVIGALFAWVLRRELPESPRWLAEHGRAPDAERIVAQLEADAARTGATPPAGTWEREAAPGDAGFSTLWRRPWRGRVAFLLVANTASSIAFYGFANWLPSLLRAQGVSSGAVFEYTAAVGLTYPVTPLLCVLFADRIERRWQIVVTALSSAALGLALARQPVGVLWTVLGVLLACSNQARATAEHVYRSELFPTALRGRAVGLVYSFTRIAAAVSSYVVGLCFARAGVIAVFMLLGGALSISAFVTAVFGPATRVAPTRRPEEEEST